MDIRTLIIGGYIIFYVRLYNKCTISEVIVTNMDGAIQSVMLPALSDEQDNKKIKING